MKVTVNIYCIVIHIYLYLYSKHVHMFFEDKYILFSQNGHCGLNRYSVGSTVLCKPSDWEPKSKFNQMLLCSCRLIQLIL